MELFVKENLPAISLHLVSKTKFGDWLQGQSAIVRSWIESTRFTHKPGAFSLLPSENGGLNGVIYCLSDQPELWDIGHLPYVVPEGVYQLTGEVFSYADYAIAWALGAYQFTRYKKATRQPARLILPDNIRDNVENIVSAIYQARDWINTPTDDMGPSQFAEVAEKMAKECGADLKQIIGEDLLKQNYASIYTVGRASDDPPRLLDMSWGDESHARITLVGKGVCFDSGGLNIKPTPYMLLMKKDMAGGAHVFALARMIMQAKLPVRLRVLVPLAENVISGGAYRPGDIIKSRSGKTIEVANTDCEGRLVMCDALTEACSEHPDLLIDMATLTGAARVALGLDVPALFSNDDAMAAEIVKISKQVNDPVWQLPIVEAYRKHLDSAFADISNDTSDSYAGAITAALFLKEFVTKDIPWLHFDMMAWNLRSRSGRPQGAEVLALRTLFTYLSQRYQT